MPKTSIACFIAAFLVLILVPKSVQANSGDFDGGVAIGSSYAGVDAAPTNGLIVQGGVGIGTTSPLSGTALNVNGAFDSNNLLLNGVQVPMTPGGRLTLTSNTPVMTADVTGASTIYYADYINDLVPLYNGTNWTEYALSGQVSLALDSNSAHTGYQQSGKLFDLVVNDNSGTPQLCTGPAWTSSTARASAIALQNGIWTNSGSWTLKCDTTSSTYTCAANECTYVGTMYATANGQTGLNCHPLAAAGGTASYIAFANIYNTVPINCISQDSTHPWTYSTSTWRAADNSSSNSVSAIDPLGMYSARGSYLTSGANTGLGQCAYVGLARNSTTTQNFSGFDCGPTNTTANNIAPFIAYGGWAPLRGYNSYYAVEYVSSGTASFNAGDNMFLQIDTTY